LGLEVEESAVSTTGFGSRDTLIFPRDSILRTAWRGYRYAAERSGIESSSFRTSWRLIVDTDSSIELGPIHTSRTFGRGAAGTGEALAIGTRRRLQRYTYVSLQQISRTTHCFSFDHTVVALQDRIATTGRRLHSDAQTAPELVSIVTGWFCLEDACLAIGRTATGADRCPENTGLSIKLRSLWTTFDMASGWVGSRDNIVKGVFPIGALDLAVLGCGTGRRERKGQRQRNSCHVGQ
jgi:hypothetical protein